MDFVFIVLGLVILLLAGDVLVRGAVNVSLRLGVPALIVSLTIVAIGTSAPEMLVAVDAVVGGVPGLATGNVVGSNIANVLLVLGVPALLFGLGNSDSDIRQGYVQMIMATSVFAILAFTTIISWTSGVFLILIFVGFMGRSVYSARRRVLKTQVPVEIEGADPAMPWWKISVFLVLGLIGLPLGAELLVGGATQIARSFQISETVIGLTLVAIGTSLPELATTITAAYRRHAEVAFGNVIGSNIANLLGIIGVASLFGDIPVSQAVLKFDIWVMIGASVLLAPFAFFGQNLSRSWGAVFTVLYVGYIILVLTTRSV